MWFIHLVEKMLLSPLPSSCLKVLESIMVNGAMVAFPFSFIVTWLCFLFSLNMHVTVTILCKKIFRAGKKKNKSTQKPDVYLDTLKNASILNPALIFFKAVPNSKWFSTVNVVLRTGYSKFKIHTDCLTVVRQITYYCELIQFFEKKTAVLKDCNN